MRLQQFLDFLHIFNIWEARGFFYTQHGTQALLLPYFALSSCQVYKKIKPSHYMPSLLLQLLAVKAINRPCNKRYSRISPKQYFLVLSKHLYFVQLRLRYHSLVNILEYIHWHIFPSFKLSVISLLFTSVLFTWPSIVRFLNNFY